jgi:ABC-type polysaccharide/polyol phosphate transport system ATPase subunit
MAEEPIIEVKGLWKRYGLPPFLPWKKRQVADHEWALRDISFSLPRGGSLGILGRNGAGKSTLLKLLAGVTPPDKGSIAIRGRIFPMIELAAGMSMELSGRENIRILGTIMGLSGREIERIIPEVEDFSELGDWIYRPVWQYSSGMVGRLAFGMAVHMRADILLVDEVLSTGDIMFQKKCQQKVQALLSGGTTLLFVSHSPYQVERLCEEAILLDQGGIVTQGPATPVMRTYLERTILSAAARSGKAGLSSLSPELRPGTGDLRITAVEVQPVSGEPQKEIRVGDDVRIILSYEAKTEIVNFNFNIALTNTQGMTVALLGIVPEEKPYSLPKGKGAIICALQTIPLMGDFFISTNIKTTYLLDQAENIGFFSCRLMPKQQARTNNVGNLYMKPIWSFMQKTEEKQKTQDFDATGVEPEEIKIYYYKNDAGEFDYEEYKKAQIEANIRKIDLTSIDARDIEMLSRWIKEHVSPLTTGICHGTRNGKEQKLFREHTGADVIGTDISPTAEQFANTIQHDFHEIKPEWLNHFDFIFSNSYDHSYNLEYCIRQWISTLRPGGVCILEHSSGHMNVKKTDPTGITRKAFCHLLEYWGKGTFHIKTILNGVKKQINNDASFVYTEQIFIIVEKLNLY